MRQRCIIGCAIVFLTVASSGLAQQGQKSLADLKPGERVQEVMGWPSCDEYIPTNEPCKVVVNMSAKPAGLLLPRAPFDITIRPAGEAAVLLVNTSPFLSCTLAATPGTLTRDESTSITTFLTALGTLGALGANPVISDVNLSLTIAGVAPNAAGVPAELARRRTAVHGPAERLVQEIDAQLDRIEGDSKLAANEIDGFSGVLKELRNVLQDNWSYEYGSDKEFEESATKLFPQLDHFLKQPLPNVGSAQVELTAISNAMADFHRRFDIAAASDPDLANWIQAVNVRVETDTGNANLLQDHVSDLLTARTQIKQAFVFLRSLADAHGNFNKTPYFMSVLYPPMTRFAQKQVTEVITCKDSVTQTQAFDAITFTAYYENSPHLDFSAGALVSFLGGRQVGTISGPCPQSGGVCSTAPNTVLAVTSRSRVQWIPTAFIEYHPWNFKCPWATTGSPEHKFGYVCSFGGAFGLAVNPNNGTTNAEYFEGVSFGIHRVAIFFGNHSGRFQDFTGGYSVGETVPSGTTPPTYRRWTNHPAIGISYRIPLR